MAVPKRKTTQSRRGQRRGGNGALRTAMLTVVENKTTGAYQLPHHISEDGFYNGRKVVADKVKKQKPEQNEE